MFQLHDKDEGTLLGQVDETQVRFLIDHLEETDSADQDYYIDGPTLEMLEANGCDPALLGLLRSALGDRKGFEVRWEADSGGAA